MVFVIIRPIKFYGEIAMMNNVGLSGSCPICDATLILDRDILVSEIVSCDECGSELEVRGLEPLVLVEAPLEEEDWGQ